MRAKPTPPEVLIAQLRDPQVDGERKADIIRMLCAFGIVAYTALVNAGIGSELWLRTPDGRWQKVTSLDCVPTERLQP